MRTRLFAIGLAAISAALVACGGGGGSSGGTIPSVTPTPSSSGAPTAPPIPQSTPFSASTSVTLLQPTPAPGGQTAGSFSVSLPLAYLPGGSTPVTGSIAFPGQYAVVGNGEGLTIALQSTAPSGVPAISGPRSPIVYFGLQFSPNVVGLETPPSFSITVPSADILPGASYWLASFDPSQPSLGWQYGFEGPVVSPKTSALIFSGGGLFDFVTGGTYWFALYAASNGLAAPTPAPTTAPVSFGCTNQPFDNRRRALGTGPRPLASGDTFSYGGPKSTMTQTLSRVAPCPMPTSTAVAAVNDAVTVSATTAPAPFATAAWDAKSIESDAFPTSTVTTTTDSILGENSTSEFTYGSTVTDENGDTITTTYDVPQTLAELPEAQGNTWTFDPAGSVHEVLTDGSWTTRAYNPDGSYTDTEQTPAGSATITVNPNGSGKYVVSTAGTVSFGAPQNGTIPVTLTANGNTQSVSIPQWFNAPVSLYQDTFTDNGSGPQPWCTPAVTVGNLEQIVESVNILDPVLGYKEARQVSYYDDPTYGTVCMTITDTMYEYYDYLFDTPFLPYLSANGSPNQTDTITETYVMNATPTINSVTRRSGGANAFARGAIASIDAVRALQREALRRELRSYVQRGAAHGGKI